MDNLNTTPYIQTLVHTTHAHYYGAENAQSLYEKYVDLMQQLQKNSTDTDIFYNYQLLGSILSTVLGQEPIPKPLNASAVLRYMDTVYTSLFPGAPRTALLHIFQTESEADWVRLLSTPFPISDALTNQIVLCNSTLQTIMLGFFNIDIGAHLLKDSSVPKIVNWQQKQQPIIATIQKGILGNKNISFPGEEIYLDTKLAASIN